MSAPPTTTTTNAPLGGNLGAFPPSLTTTPLPLLLQNPSATGRSLASLGLYRL
ncbi:MAG: hypothetical protein JNJ78_03125 [Anaerolineae bacterium]|nr:hypothetical protein [Anaerolineae bacterium]